jgi:hypothetical protein
MNVRRLRAILAATIARYLSEPSSAAKLFARDAANDTGKFSDAVRPPRDSTPLEARSTRAENVYREMAPAESVVRNCR